jgi:hypothetical protein
MLGSAIADCIRYGPTGFGVVAILEYSTLLFFANLAMFGMW